MNMAIRETNFELPGQVGPVYHGKVGDTYAIDHEAGNLIAVVRTDRISAFNAHLPEPIPHKGQVLNEMSAELLATTASVAPNWFIESPDPNVTVGFRADPIKVEMIMRNYLLGSSWKGYQQGMRDLCGNRLPDGMQEFQPFDEVLVTPTTKTADDENITPADIIASGLATAEEYDEMVRLSTNLFASGQEIARSRGLLLADTKFEFGRLASGQVVVIDEALTPDSSRYFPRDQFDAYLHGQTDGRPKQLSKEFVREWLESMGFSGTAGQEPPRMPEEFIQQVSERYIGLYKRVLGRPFESAPGNNEAEIAERMRENIVSSLGDLSLGGAN